MLGIKLYVKCSNVIVIKVPHYKGLHVKDLLKFAESKVNIKKNLPEYEYWKEPNKEWLWSLINTLITKEFHEFIDEKVEQRKFDLISNQNLGIWVKPEFVNILKMSQAVSTMNGKSHFLARMPKQSKDKKQIGELEDKRRNLI